MSQADRTTLLHEGTHPSLLQEAHDGAATVMTSQPRASDSWIEIASHSPSSSMTPSGHDRNALRPLSSLRAARRQRRRSGNVQSSNPTLRGLRNTHDGPALDGSSQEEYEESESESDRIMSSSNEVTPASDVSLLFMRNATTASSDEEEGRSNHNVASVSSERHRFAECFTPQPNAFTRPPLSTLNSSSSRTRRASDETALARPASRSTTRSTARSQNQHSHSPFGTSMSSHQADHDAVLRASLSTLLSFGAVVRSMPKRDGIEQSRSASQHEPAAANANRVEPRTLRIVPESAITNKQQRTARPTSAEMTHTDSMIDDAHDKGKRKALRSSSKERRASKKLKTLGLDGALVSPTLLTWAVSAGVLVLVSTLSFCAGYSAGRNASRFEVSVGDGFQSCGKEAVRGTGGLRRRLIGEAANAAALARV